MKNILRRMPRILIISACVIALLSISVMAYLSTSTDGVSNIFRPADEKTPNILEGDDGNPFDGITKEKVRVDVGATGYAVYVRAVIVVNWEENKEDIEGKKTIIGDTGIFHGDAPVAGEDYIINLNTEPSAPWFRGADGFYYHKTMINSEGATADLIESCQVVTGKAPDGYHLDVQIVAQTIQALGGTDEDNTPAVTDAWKVVAVDSNSKELFDALS